MLMGAFIKAAPACFMKSKNGHELNHLAPHKGQLQILLGAPEL